MKLYLLSFIGIAINIWVDISGGGGSGPGSLGLRDRAGDLIHTRDGQVIFTRV